MITIKVNGLDQFVVGELSSECSTNIANIYEVSVDDVNFVAPSTMVFHNGNEQTSWHVIIEVLAPMKVHVLQEQMALYLIKVFKEVAIHVEVIFQYYSEDHRVLSVNDEYPRYITDTNTVNIAEEEYDECDDNCDDDCECGHHHDHEEIYDGDIFEEFNKIVSKK